MSDGYRSNKPFIQCHPYGYTAVTDEQEQIKMAANFEFDDCWLALCKRDLKPAVHTAVRKRLAELQGGDL